MAARRKWTDCFLLMTLLLALSGCESLRIGRPLGLALSDRTTDGGSVARTNTTAEAPLPPLAQRWEHDTEGGFAPPAPLIAGGFVIVSTRGGSVDVIELSTGRKIGSVSLGDAIEGAPVLVDSRILVVPVAAGKHGLVAYDLTSGARPWQLRNNLHAAGLLYSSRTIVAAALDGTIRGIEPGTGAERWAMQFDSTRAFYAAPTHIAEDLVAVADDAGGIVALNPATGVVAWRYEIGKPVVRTPAAAAGLLFVPTTEGDLMALDVTSGAVVWILQAASALVRFTSPAVDERFLIVGATDGFVRCLDPSTGELIWDRKFDGNVSAAPLLAGDVVYVGTQDEHIAALNATTGELIWEEEIPGRIKSGLAARDGILVVLSEPKAVIAFETQRLASTSAGN